MVHPLGPKDDMQRMVLRKSEATAQGDHVFQRRFQLAEIRESGEAQRAATIEQPVPARRHLAAALNSTRRGLAL